MSTQVTAEPNGFSVDSSAKSDAIGADALLERLREREAEDAQLLRMVRERRTQIRQEDALLAQAEAKLSGTPTVGPAPIPAQPSVIGQAEVSVRRRVLMFLGTCGGKGTSTEAVSASMSDVPLGAVRQALYDMASKPKTIERIGASTWRITAKGRDLLQGGV